jgi:hypothetical protein
MAGSFDKNFCPLGHYSFTNNLTPEIYTGDYARNIHFHEVVGQGHWGVNSSVAPIEKLINTDLSAFYNMHDTAYDCD